MMITSYSALRSMKKASQFYPLKIWLQISYESIEFVIICSVPAAFKIDLLIMCFVKRDFVNY